jgi:hypothetical protein
MPRLWSFRRITAESPVRRLSWRNKHGGSCTETEHSDLEIYVTLNRRVGELRERYGFPKNITTMTSCYVYTLWAGGYDQRWKTLSRRKTRGKRAEICCSIVLLILQTQKTEDAGSREMSGNLHIEIHGANAHIAVLLTKYYFSVLYGLRVHLCGLVVRVPGYRSRGLGSIPEATRVSEK